MKTKNRLIGVRNFIVIMLVFTAVLFAADKLLPVFSVQINPEAYDDSVDFMRLEKTPVESFLAAAEAKALCRVHGIDISGYQMNAYPIIEDMPSTEKTGENTVNIVVIGDSFVWGDNSLNRNELFWRQTEQILRSRGYDCKVTAIAMAGANAYEELGWYESYLKEHTPDLAVFGYVFNDTLPVEEDPTPEENQEYADYIPLLKPIALLLPNIYDRLSSYIDAKTLYSEKYDDRRPEALKGILKGEVRDYYQKNFADRLDSITKERQIPAVVMTLPVIPRGVIFKALFRPLQEIFAGTSVTFYDTYKAFDAFYAPKHRKNIFVNPGNNHPGSAVHYFYASFLADALERDFAGILGEKHAESLQSRILHINECTPCGIGLQTTAQSETQAEYTFTYPKKELHRYLFSSVENYWLTYPLGKSYVKLSFENPVDLSGLELSGAPAETTEIYYTKINKKLCYDDNALYRIPLTDLGNGVGGEIGDTKITSLCIHMDADAALAYPLRLTVHS